MSHRRVLIVSLVAGLCSGVGSARAQSPTELPDCGSYPACETVFLQARQQSDQGNLSQALRLYKAAYEVRADPVILFSIARVLHKQGQGPEAVGYYQRFIDSPLDKPELKAKAREHQAQLEPVAPKPVNSPPPQPEPAQVAVPVPAPLSPQPLQQTAPVYRKGWFWGIVGGGVAAVALGIGLGVGLAKRVPTIPEGMNTYEPSF